MIALSVLVLSGASALVMLIRALRKNGRPVDARLSVFIAVMGLFAGFLCSMMQLSVSDPVTVREAGTTDLVEVSGVYLTADVEHRDAVYTYFVENEDGSLQEQSASRNSASIRTSDHARVVIFEREYPAGLFSPWPTQAAPGYVFYIPAHGFER